MQCQFSGSLQPGAPSAKLCGTLDSDVYWEYSFVHNVFLFKVGKKKKKTENRKKLEKVRE